MSTSNNTKAEKEALITAARIKWQNKSTLEMYAELCLFYPQYKLEDLLLEPDEADQRGIKILTLANMNILLTVAKRHYLTDRLMALQDMRAAQADKNGYDQHASQYRRMLHEIDHPKKSGGAK